MTAKTRATLLCSSLLALITLAVYWPSVHFDFINYDDPDYVIYNPAIQHGLNGKLVAWALKTNYASNWHPLTWISHAVDYSLFGLSPGAPHLVNILFHTVNAVLLFLVLVQLTGAIWRAGLVAALFAWHPLHVESVAWISERKDVLSTCFWLLTLAAYGKYAAALAREKGSGERRRAGRFYLLALSGFALGLLAKPMVVTLPFVLLLLDYWPLKRPFRWNWLILEKFPFFALALAECLVTLWAQKAGNAVVTAAALPLSARVANALVSYVRYLGKTFWPVDLALPYPFSQQWRFWQAAGAAGLLLAITLILLLRARRQPWLIVGWLWFLGTLVPAVGFVQVGLQAMADRYTYIPLIGLFIMAAWSIPGKWLAWPRPGLAVGAVIGAGLIFLLAAMETQLQYWRNSVTLFGHTVQLTRDNILAEYNLAEALARAGDEDAAVAHYRQALAIHANPVEAQYNSQTQAHYNLGLIYRVRKEWPAAAEQFRAFQRDEPTLVNGHLNLGVALIGEGREAEAGKEFRAAMAAAPGEHGEAEYLGLMDAAYAEAGKFEQAIAAAEKTRQAALDEGRMALAKAAEQRLERYRAGKP